MKKRTLFLILFMISAFHLTNPKNEPSLSLPTFSFANLAKTTVLDLIYINLGTSENFPIIYKLNQTSIIIPQQKNGFSLINALPQSPTITQLSTDNKLMLIPKNEQLYPHVNIKVDEQYDSLHITSTLNFGIINTESSTSYFVTLYFQLLKDLLRNNNFTINEKTKALTKDGRPISIICNLMIDFNGGHIASLHIQESQSKKILATFDRANLKKEGVLIEYF